MTRRIYTVSNGDEDRLVRATSRAQAISHVARSVFEARVATQDDLVTGMQSGVKVEDAGADGAGEQS